MTQVRTDVNASANQVRMQGPNDILMSQLRLTPRTTVGAATLTAAEVLSGAIYRTGPVAGYIDTFPTAAEICAACIDLGAGDSFELLFINTVAFANTVAGNTGLLLGVNTSVPASNQRRFLLTCIAPGSTDIASVSTLSGSATISNIGADKIIKIVPGMGVSGTGIPALAFITGVVNNGTNNNSITISANATATGALVALTFFPRIQLDGLSSGAL